MTYFGAILIKNLKLMQMYKWHYIADLCLNPVAIAVIISLFKTIYAYDQSQIILGYTLSQMIWYYGAMTFFYIFVWSDPDKEISQDILSGYMAIRLTYPLSVMKVALVNAVTARLTNILISFLPTFLTYSLLVYPEFLTWAGFGKYLVVNCLAFLLFFLFSFTLGISAFKYQSITTLRSVKNVLILTAGVCIPFDFLPKVIQSVIRSLPFQYIYYIPVQFLLNTPQSQTWDFFTNTVLAQSFWIVAFYGLSRLFWQTAVKQYYSVGG